jgi:hypothetical protein
MLMKLFVRGQVAQGRSGAGSHAHDGVFCSTATNSAPYITAVLQKQCLSLLTQNLLLWYCTVYDKIFRPSKLIIFG